MTLIEMSGISSTTGSGVIARSIGAVYAGAICLLVMVGNQSAQATTSMYNIDLPADQTDANLRAPVYSIPSMTTGDAILEIRRRSGMTWEELGELFDVSRRSVHNWASGEALSAKNEHQVRMVLGAVRLIDRGDPRKTRDALMTVNGVGDVSPLALLKQGDTAAAVALAGHGATEIELQTFRPTQSRPRSRSRAATYLDAVNAPPATASGPSRLARIHRAPKGQ